MIPISKLVSRIEEVPRIWAYSHYTSVPIDRFDGSNFRVLSVLKKERTPSMGFYVKKGEYLFNDFSTGIGGDHIRLVASLFNISYNDAVVKICTDYEKFLEEGKSVTFATFKTNSKYIVSEFSIRSSWNNHDQKFWMKYPIGSKLLEEFNVRPLESYTLRKDDNSFTVCGEHLYGYFKQDGALTKIYQPYIERAKFIKVTDYVQGSEQCKGTRYMFYVSSLKDILGLRAMGIFQDMKAPDSENVMLSEHIIKRDISNHDAVFTFFDSDEAGVKAAEKYQTKYGILPIFLAMGEKDPTDHMEKYGINKTRGWIVPLIDSKISLVSRREEQLRNQPSLF